MAIPSPDTNPGANERRQPQVRAFRLMAAALNPPPMADAPDGLFSSLMPPLPLVDWDPLRAWTGPAAETAPGPARSPRPPGRQALDREVSAVTGPFPSAQPTQGLGQGGGAIAPHPAPPSPAVDGSRSPVPEAERPPGPPSVADPNSATPSPLPGGPAAPMPQPMPQPPPQPPPQGHAARSNAESSPAPSPSSAEPRTPPTASAVPELPGAGIAGAPAPLRSAAARTAADSLTPPTVLHQIDQLTTELLQRPESAPARPPAATPPSTSASSTAPSWTASPSAEGPAVGPELSQVDAMRPPAAAAPNLDLAGLAALFAREDGAGEQGVGPGSMAGPGSGRPPIPTDFTGPSGKGLGELPTAAGAAPDMSPGFTDPEAPVAETLTEMVSAILQAQAQRHGVDLS